ncbi:MAG: helix-turn-helix domain-containing protein [Sphingomonadales bacterium]|nr:helix-turn-helix domain-containing protein [Sphingomonadales bacterium]
MKGNGIRVLERGLRVFKTLQQSAALTLADLHEATGLPKPTLLRILVTLEGAGMVHRGIDDRRYRISARLTRVARKADRSDRVAEAAAPVLDRLCKKIIWPSDLAVPAHRVSGSRFFAMLRLAPADTRFGFAGQS